MKDIKWNNSEAFRPQANYTDWETATGQRILVQTFTDRRVSRGQRGGTPVVVHLSYLDRSRYFFFQVAPHLSAWGWVDYIPDPMLLRKSCGAGNRTRDLYVCSQELWPLDHRGAQYAGYTAQIVEIWNAFKFLVGKAEGKKLLWRPGHRWVDNIKMELGEIG
jgi:hypothetical protein